MSHQSSAEEDERSKTCGGCRLVKPISQFYFRVKKDQTYDYLCKGCRKERVKPRYQNLRDVRKEQFRRNYIENRGQRLESYAVYKKSPKGRATQLRASNLAYKRYPEKAIARQRLRYAVSRGEITKQPCEVCGIEKVEAHHYLGYAKENWYDVKWLCRDHHRDAHKFSLKSRGYVPTSAPS